MWCWYEWRVASSAVVPSLAAAALPNACPIQVSALDPRTPPLPR